MESCQGTASRIRWEFFPICRGVPRPRGREGSSLRIAPRAWSLRIRLIACITLVLATTLVVGTALSLRNAARLVNTELLVAREVAGRAIRDGRATHDSGPRAIATLRRRVTAFDGERHIIARLLDAQGQELAHSVPRPPPLIVPGWFHRLLTPSLPPIDIALPSGTIRLLADPDNELAERWSEFGDSLLLIGLFCLFAAGGVLWTTEWAMRPLRTLASAFRRVEAGDYAARLPEHGPPEIEGILQEFNRMATQLAVTETHNRRLHQQLLNLQEEERADLARDLHDEIGPFLFAVNMHAATIQQLSAEERASEIAAQVAAIHEAVGHMQKHVKAILGQLRPLPATAIGLAPAIEGLVTFWRYRHRDIAFVADLAVPDGMLDETSSETIYRVVQESLTNALRHGRPSRITVTLGGEADGTVQVRVADDGAGPAQPAGEGFGLAGMRERVAALGGTLTVAQGRDGWTVTARLPRAATDDALPLGIVA